MADYAAQLNRIEAKIDRSTQREAALRERLVKFIEAERGRDQDTADRLQALLADA